MATKKVYTICGMCTVRCPMVAEVENSTIKFLHGNPNASGMKTSLCPRGVAGKALINDDERIRYPMIREGERGEGKWRKVSWEEALDYTAEKIKGVVDEYGPRGVALSDRGGPFRDFHRAFLRGLGSPNYVNHDASCARNVQHAAKSVTGSGRKEVAYDYRNAKHVVLQIRNVFEAIGVQEVNDLTDAMNEGCKLSVIDIRANVSATKADNFYMIRPGTDYAFNLAVIHELLAKNLYDKEFAEKFIQDLNALKDFVKDYTPKWAENETGVAASKISDFAHQLSKAAPSVLWHPGWMMARYETTFYLCRSIYIINALLGSYGAKGGLPFVNKPKNVGRSGLKALQDLFEKPKEKRADGVGWKYPQFEQGPGLAHLLYEAMDTDDPYPVKAYIAFRHDPLMAFPEPEKLKKVFDKLDLLVSVTFTWCDTAWYADVVLPLSPYLERESVLATKNGLQPYFFMRKRAVEPRFDTKACWEIFSGLARRLGIDKLAFDKIEDVWNYQLEGTGVSIEDFAETGMVNLSDKPIYRSRDEIKFGTESGKFEIISKKLEDLGIASLKPYQSPEKPPEGQFRLTFGRCAMHTQGHTINNPALNELMPENELWINSAAAEKLHIENGEVVNVSQNGYTEQIKARVTDFVHPEAVFVLHGFGHKLPIESRAYGKGLADNKFMAGSLKKWDKAGGAVALQENFVKVSKAV